MYNAIQIADYIVNKCASDTPISNLQLQKILYYIQKHFLQETPKELFLENFEAWQFGPVVPEVYSKYCGFGGMKIRVKNDINFSIKEPEYEKIIIDIVNEKKVLDPWVMVEDTHKPNKAWARIYKNGEGNHHIIPKELIRTNG